MTQLDETHSVVAKPPNVFLARTEKLSENCYDSHIRMIDDHEFFLRAAGKMVSVLDMKAFAFYYHNYFDRRRLKFRNDWHQNRMYIHNKHNAGRQG